MFKSANPNFWLKVIPSVTQSESPLTLTDKQLELETPNINFNTGNGMYSDGEMEAIHELFTLPNARADLNTRMGQSWNKKPVTGGDGAGPTIWDVLPATPHSILSSLFGTAWEYVKDTLSIVYSIGLTLVALFVTIQLIKICLKEKSIKGIFLGLWLIVTLSGTSLYQNYLDYKKKQCNKKAGNQSAPTDSELGLTDKETAPTVNQ